MHLPRTRLLVVALATVALAVATGAPTDAATSAVSQTLHAYVHEDNSIGMTFDDGSDVQGTIPPGTYTVKVVDDADIHNFHLMGPGLDMLTDVNGLASPTWTVTFQPGSTYTYQCDPHSDFMYGAFHTSGAATGTSVGSGSVSSSSSTTGSTNGSAPARGRLTAALGLKGAPSLTLAGKKPGVLQAGRYTVSVIDGSKAHGLALRLAGHTVALSAKAFVGKRSTSVTLAVAGRWTLVSV
jgi:plastocyanin